MAVTINIIRRRKCARFVFSINNTRKYKYPIIITIHPIYTCFGTRWWMNRVCPKKSHFAAPNKHTMAAQPPKRLMINGTIDRPSPSTTKQTKNGRCSLATRIKGKIAPNESTRPTLSSQPANTIGTLFGQGECLMSGPECSDTYIIWLWPW